jgi:hypothetical protein
MEYDMKPPSWASSLVPTRGNSERGTDRSRVARLLVIVTAAYFLAGLYAAFSHRGLFADGSYYLVKVVQQQDFYVVFPPRKLVQALQQAPVIPLVRMTTLSLAELGKVHSLSMLLIPILLCAVCWPILPPERKSWIIFPILHLTIGVSASSFAAVGEAAIAAGYFWPLLFLLLFRTRRPISQALFLLLCLAAFWLHEAAIVLMPVLLLVCWLRLKEARSLREQAFLALSAILILSIIAYEIRWFIYPYRPDELSSYLENLTAGFFVAGYGRVNLPAVTGALALVAISSVVILQIFKPAEVAARGSLPVVIVFACWALLAALCAWFVDAAFAPYLQFQARYHPVFVSALLALAAIAANHWQSLEHAITRPPVLIVTLALCFAQILWDVAATTRWRSYLDDFRARLANSTGLIPWEQTLDTGDPVKDREWRLLAWQMPAMSLIFADGMRIRSIIANPVGHWQPFDLSNPDALPKLRGVDYGPYREALMSGSRAQDRQ